MKTQPERKRGTLIFWLFFLAVAGAIFATVLGANDGRNYKKLMARMGFQLSEGPKTMVIPKPGVIRKYKGKRLKNVGIAIDQHIFLPEVTGRDSAFLRSVEHDGSTLCEVFTKRGFKMSKWQPGAFSSALNECWAEEIGPDAAHPDELFSFFLMVKGTKEELVSTRVKFIFADQVSRDRMAEKAITVLEEYAREMHWGDLAEHREDIRALKPFTINAFGITAKFSAEFSGTGRYNLILDRSGALTPAQKRTREFFDQTRFLLMPPEAGGKPRPKRIPERVQPPLMPGDTEDATQPAQEAQPMPEVQQ